MSDDIDDDRALAKEIRRFVKIIVKAHKEDRIDDDEHDLLIEELEDIDPEGRSFDKVNEEEEYYTGDGVPDTPSVKVGKNVDLDSLMRKKSWFLRVQTSQRIAIANISRRKRPAWCTNRAVGPP